MNQGIPNIDRFLAYCEIKEVKAKSEIYHCDSLSDRLYFILNGSVVLLKDELLYKEFIVGYYSENEFFGIQDLYESEGSKRGVNAVARVNSLIAEIDYERFKQLAKIYPDIMTELHTQIVSRLKKMIQRTYEMATFDAKSKVINCLKELCSLPEATQIDEGVQIKVSCLEISKMVGCTRECVGRMVQELINKGQIDRKGHTFIIYDVNKEMA